MLNDDYYIDMAEIVHEAVIHWDPIGLIKGGAPKDEYYTIEKRFLSGIINADSTTDILNKVKGNLKEYGLEEDELSTKQVDQLNSEIRKIIEELRKRALEIK